MAFQPAPNICSATIHYNSTDVFWSNVLHFQRTGFTPEDMADLAEALRTGMLALLMEELPEAVNCTGITLYDLNAQDAPRLIHTFVAPIVGGDVGAEITNATGAAVLTFYTSGRGKTKQGRMYIAGVAESFADERRVQDGKMTNLKEALEDLLDNPPAGFTWVILSRYLNKAKRAEAVATPVTSVVARSGIWGSQDRRVKRP